jgi:hypothetical protein
MTRLAALALVLATGGVASAERPRSFTVTYLPVAWYPADGERGPWPAIGATVEAAALDCTARGEGGAPPIGCRAIHLTSELRAAPSRFATCYTLRPTVLPPRAVAGYARTGGIGRPVLLFVAHRSHHTEEVLGRCQQTGIDACMPGVRPVIGHRVVRETDHAVEAWAPELAADPFAVQHGTVGWLAPEGQPWPAPPIPATSKAASVSDVPPPYDEGPLAALQADPDPAIRFAAWVDLVAARLVARDAAGARDALGRAADLAVDLTGTAFDAAALTADLPRHATAADIDAIAHGPGTDAARHARLRAILGASAVRTEDRGHLETVARDLRNTLRPAATNARSFVRGEDPLLYVPELLGELSRRVGERWTDPCAPQP